MSALDRGKLLSATLCPTESWLRQQSSISPDPQKNHSNNIKIHSNGHCLWRGPGARLFLLQLQGVCVTHVTNPQGWAVSPGSWRDAVLQDTGSQAQQAQECFGSGLPCTQSSKAAVCTAGPAFHHLQLFN